MPSQAAIHSAASRPIACHQVTRLSRLRSRQRWRIGKTASLAVDQPMRRTPAPSDCRSLPRPGGRPLGNCHSPATTWTKHLGLDSIPYRLAPSLNHPRKKSRRRASPPPRNSRNRPRDSSCHPARSRCHLPHWKNSRHPPCSRRRRSHFRPRNSNHCQNSNCHRRRHHPYRKCRRMKHRSAYPSSTTRTLIRTESLAAGTRPAPRRDRLPPGSQRPSSGCASRKDAPSAVTRSSLRSGRLPRATRINVCSNR